MPLELQVMNTAVCILVYKLRGIDFDPHYAHQNNVELIDGSKPNGCRPRSCSKSSTLSRHFRSHFVKIEVRNAT